jgi:hypothetical protein
MRKIRMFLLQVPEMLHSLRNKIGIHILHWKVLFQWDVIQNQLRELVLTSQRKDLRAAKSFLFRHRWNESYGILDYRYET